VIASSSVGPVLLVLKIAFLVLLYAFVWRVIRTAGREPNVGARARAGAGAGPAADSMILTPSVAAAAGLGTAAARPRRPVHLVVLRSPSLETDAMFPVDSAPVTVGRGGQNDLVLDGDEFASARHARIEARPDGIWVQDLDSTNGTFLNGARVVGAERMSPGDVLRVGETDLRVEEG
jgi:FHA domain